MIKLEKWGKNKREVLVERDERGTLVTWTNTKGRSIDELRNLYKKNRTFDKDVVRVDLKNVREIYSKNKPKNAESYQYYISGTAKGKTIHSRSLQEPISFPASKMKSDAFEEFYRAVASIVYGDSDKELKDSDYNITSQGFIHYKRK